MTLSKQSIAQAQSQINVQEYPKGSNAGPGVEKYLKCVGLGKGYAWCMAFVYWCVSEASKIEGITNPLVKTALVMKQWNESAKLRVKDPQPGDIFIMDFGNGTGHTGFVLKVMSNGDIKTIEGNTDDGKGSREGYIITERIRKKSTIKGYLRI